MNRLLLLLFIWFVLGSVGCRSDRLTKEQYATAWLSITHDFERSMSNLSTATIVTSGTPEDKLRATGRQTRRTAGEIKLIADRLEHLHPPDEFKPLHKATDDFLLGYAENMETWGKAFESGDKTAITKSGLAMTRNGQDRWRRVLAEAKVLKLVDDATIKRQVQEVQAGSSSK
jgi:hypothetical protein